MRALAFIAVLLLASPAVAHHASTGPAIAPLALSDSLAGTQAQGVVEYGVEVSRTWTLAADQYDGAMIRCQFDVQFGPVANEARDGSTVSVWSDADPAMAAALHRLRLSRVVVVREGRTVRIAAFAERVPPTVVASAN
jgi:hypothetical protein